MPSGRCPVTAKQGVCPAIPPQVRATMFPLPLYSEMPRPERLIPEKPTVGPPVRIWLPPTPVRVTQMLPAPQVLPTETEAVATWVVPTNRSNTETESADAVGTMAKATNGRTKAESLRLVIRTTDPP